MTNSDAELIYGAYLAAYAAVLSGGLVQIAKPETRNLMGQLPLYLSIAAALGVLDAKSTRTPMTWPLLSKRLSDQLKREDSE